MQCVLFRVDATLRKAEVPVIILGKARKKEVEKLSMSSLAMREHNCGSCPCYPNACTSHSIVVVLLKRHRWATSRCVFHSGVSWLMQMVGNPL